MYFSRQYQPFIFRRILTSFNISSPDVSDMEADPLNIAAAKVPCFREFLSCSFFFPLGLLYLSPDAIARIPLALNIPATRMRML